MKTIDFMWRKKGMQRLSKSTAGFTLVEVLVVVVMVGVLSAMASYSLQSWANRVRVNGVQDKVLSAIREGQTRSRQQASNWQVSFSQVAESGELKVQMAIHPANTTPTQWTVIDEPGVQIDENITFTTLNTETIPGGSKLWKVEFDNKGNVARGQTIPARITISYKGTVPRRCVEVVTLLGATRSEGDGSCGN